MKSCNVSGVIFNMINYKEFNVKVALILAVFSLFFFIPVIYGGGFYADDIYRINISAGGFEWDSFGRYLSTDIAALYSANSRLIIDSSPFSWILSISLIAFSSIAIFCKLNRDYKYFSLSLSFIFIVNPFFMHNLLYRFDNLGMFLAMFFSVLAFSVNNDSKVNLLVKSLFLLISLNFYQTFSNLFISLVAIELALAAIKGASNKRLIAFSLNSLCAYLLAIIVYYVELKILGEGLNRGELLAVNLQSIPVVISNFYDALIPFFDYWSHFKWFAIISFVPVVLSFIFSSISIRIKLILLFCYFVVFISTIGTMALLKEQYLVPRCLHYFSPIMMLSVIVLIIANRNLKWVMVIPVFACFIFSYRVGNMQRVQSNYEKPIIYGLSVDLSSINGITKYYSIGSVPYSRFITNIRSNTPFNGFMNRENWNTVGVIGEYSPKGLVAFEWTSQAIKTEQKFNREKGKMLLSIDKSPFYKIYTFNKEGWIVWL